MSSVNKFKNKARNALNAVSGMSSNTLMYGAIGLAVVLVVGMIAYFIYQKVKVKSQDATDNPLLVANVINASDSTNQLNWILPSIPVANPQVPTSVSNVEFSYSFWMYYESMDYRYGREKTILRRGDVPSNYFLKICLDPFDSILHFKLKLDNGEVSEVPIPIVPQRWINIVYSVQNRTQDIYVNGKLKSIWSRTPSVDTGKLYLFPEEDTISTNPPVKQSGFFGQFSGLKYYSSALKPIDVNRIVMNGPYFTNSTPLSAIKKDDTAKPTCKPN